MLKCREIPTRMNEIGAGLLKWNSANAEYNGVVEKTLKQFRP
jgi:hypothetical protein